MLVVFLRIRGFDQKHSHKFQAEINARNNVTLAHVLRIYFQVNAKWYKKQNTLRRDIVRPIITRE